LAIIEVAGVGRPILSRGVPAPYTLGHGQAWETITMTTVIVNAGACGFSVSINAEVTKDKTIKISLDTECGMVKDMLEDIATLNPFITLTGFQNNPVYQSASKHLKHVACLVPSGILKAIEVEAGLNVPKEARIRFEMKK
jgi:hypothetical protein